MTNNPRMMSLRAGVPNGRVTSRDVRRCHAVREVLPRRRHGARKSGGSEAPQRDFNQHSSAGREGRFPAHTSRPDPSEADIQRLNSPACAAFRVGSG